MSNVTAAPGVVEKISLKLHLTRSNRSNPDVVTALLFKHCVVIESNFSKTSGAADRRSRTHDWRQQSKEHRVVVHSKGMNIFSQKMGIFLPNLLPFFRLVSFRFSAS